MTTGRPNGSFVVGRGRFAAISAVEGAVIGENGRRRVLQMDRQGLSPEQRRRAIMEAYSKTTS